LGKSKNNNKVPETVIQTETKTVVEKEYLPGRTVIQPLEDLPPKFPRKVAILSEEYLEDDGSDDIEGIESVGVAINWSAQYHDLRLLYTELVNWYLGMKDGQVQTQKGLDAANPNAPGVPKNEIPEP